MMLDMGQLRVVFGEGWKIFMDGDIGVTIVGASVAKWLLMDEVYGPKNAFSKFMNLSNINYKFMDHKYIFRVYGPMFSIFIDLLA